MGPDHNEQTSKFRLSTECIDMLGARLEFVAHLGPNDVDAVLFRSSMAPSQLVPLHSHADPESLYVLAGELSVFVDDERPGWRLIEVGRSVLITGGVRHADRNAGAWPVDLITVTNNRMRRFFKEAGRASTPDAAIVPPTADDVARVAHAARKFGYWLSSPEESAAVTNGDRPVGA